ncbi:MAG: ribonuclease HI family protein [Pseudomonadota bacterium]
MTVDNSLIDAASRAEMVASRRLAQRSGVTLAQALRLILEQAAGAAGLARLLGERERARQAATAARADRQALKARQWADKQARHAAPSGAWTGWFDGSAHPNPGRLGIGALLTGPAGERVEVSRAAGHGNSGQAEYLALIALLEAALPLGPAQLVVYGDSRVVIDDVNRRHHGRGASGLESYLAKVAQLIAQLDELTLIWIPRHKNGAADQLSQAAIRSSAAPQR